MFEEVQHPNLLDESFTPKTNAFYCAYCIDAAKDGYGWTGVYGIEQHLKQKHGHEAAAIPGRHFLTAEDLWSKLIEWRQKNRETADRLAPHFESLRGVDDFLLECGAA
jgi:hypothetical protein